MADDHIVPRLFLNKSGKRKRNGNSLVEFCLLLPWYFFLFVGSYDFGMYSYSLIAVEDGARVAALNASRDSTSAGDSATACGFVLDSLRNLPNIGSGVTSCTSPVTVTAVSGTGPDGAAGTVVTVAYTSPQLIPIPGLLPGQLVITRIVKMRVRS